MNPIKWFIEWDGYLTAEGQFLDKYEWHSTALGLMDGFRDISLTKGWEENRENMHHKLEFQYYKHGWIVGKQIPQRPVMFIFGVISGLGLSELLNLVNF